MNIFILEDELIQRQKFVALVKQIAQQRNLKIGHLMATSHPDELLAQMTQVGPQQLYFLDIELRNSDKRGLEVAQMIRKQDDFGTIIFVTTHSEFAPLTYGYKVAALDFIAKDQPAASFQEQVASDLIYVASRQGKDDTQDYFCFESKVKSFRLPYDELMYFETATQPHKLVLITENQRIEFYASISDIARSDQRLLMVHRSFVVNLENVLSYDKTELTVTMSNGDICPVARRKIGKVEHWLQDRERREIEE